MSKTTKSSVNPYRQKMLQAVRDKFINLGVDNISLYMPFATNEDLEFWARHFRATSKEPFGYIRFQQ